VTTRIALATCDRHPGFVANDDGALADALAPLGIDAELAIWNDPGVEWAAFDACLVRTTWDYMDRLDEFLAWMQRMEATLPIFNSLSVARKNLDKAYLKRVEAAGAPIVPTLWTPRGETLELRGALDERGWEDLVIKPTVGAGASGLLRAHRDDLDVITNHLAALHRASDAFIQPFLPGVVERGELSIVFIEGEITHAVRKRAAEGDFRVQIEFGGRYEVEAPAPEAVRVAEAAMTPWTPTPLYARVDLVEPAPGRYQVIEVELVEPELFFPWVPEAGRRLGEALMRRLEGRPLGATPSA
jgi:glutathione synthase/RimK-type ligase-like ATP-grasp enzyme